MSIMRTKGQGSVVLTSTPKGNGWASAMGWAAKYYQQNQTQKNPNFDTRGKLVIQNYNACLLYTSPSPRDRQKSRMPSSA